jgi:YD repeat-containing protein
MEEIKSDSRGNITSTFYNIYGKPYRIEYPDGTYETFEYTREGNLKSSADRAGNITLYEYDSLGNPVSIYTFFGSDDSHDWYKLSRYTYDEAGNKLSAETFSYGEPTSAGSGEVIALAGDRVTYEYDLDGNPIRVVGPGNREVISDDPVHLQTMYKNQNTVDIIMGK